MRERPILFSAPMVRALVAGTKTQTRRVMKVQPDPEASVTVERYHPTVVDKHGDEQPGAEIFGAWWHDGECGVVCPYGQPGDRLWVRESLKAVYNEHGYIIDYAYSADDAKVPRCPDLAEWASDAAAFVHLQRPGGVPSIHMPRWACRIVLEITGVRVERLQDISEADAIAEGCTNSLHLQGGRFATENFAHLWWQINGDGSWEANPWVWVVEFKRVTP